MATQQPVWEYIGNFGDVHPLDHGGYFVYYDKTGVYGVEAALLEPLENGKFNLFRFRCEKCSFVNGILSDNKFHPDKPAWFADKLYSIAQSYGISREGLIDYFISDDPQTLAGAWKIVGEYFGFDNLDSYPIELTRAGVYNKFRKECFPRACRRAKKVS